MATSQQLENYIANAQAMAQANSAQSQSFAREQMAFQEAQAAKAMQFNAQQAQINRDWQERMSNTAHQREIADLRAAGLNPVLSAMRGQGASVGTGATASGYAPSGASGNVDTSATQLMGSLINALTSTSVARINQDTALQTANINAKTNVLIQDMKNDLEVYIKKHFPDNMTQFWSRFAGNIIYDLMGDNPNLQGIMKEILGDIGETVYNETQARSREYQLQQKVKDAEKAMAGDKYYAGKNRK